MSFYPTGVTASVGAGHTATNGLPTTLDVTDLEVTGTTGANAVASGLGVTLLVVDGTTVALAVPATLGAALGSNAGGALTAGLPLAGYAATTVTGPVVLTTLVVAAAVFTVALGEGAASDLVTAAALVAGAVALANFAKLSKAGATTFPGEVTAAGLGVLDVLGAGAGVVEVTTTGLAPCFHILTSTGAGYLAAALHFPFGVCLTLTGHVCLASLGTSLLAISFAGVDVRSGLVVNFSIGGEGYCKQQYPTEKGSENVSHRALLN